MSNKNTLRAEFDVIGERTDAACLSVSGSWPRQGNGVLCVVARRSLADDELLNQSVYFNCFDFRDDPQGEKLRAILLAATPVCADTQLAYAVSQQTESQRAAGTNMLPVSGQPIFTGDGEAHDPRRLIMLVEHHPATVENLLNSDPVLKQWYQQEWLELIVLHPENVPATQNPFYTVQGTIRSSCERPE